MWGRHMARYGRSRVAFLAAGAVGALLVVVELAARSPRLVGTPMRTPSSLVTEVLDGTVGVDLVGWPALLVPVAVVLLVGMLIDAISGTGR